MQKKEPTEGEIDAPRVGLAELVKDKQATTNAQRLAVFAYFRDQYQKKSRFSRADLESYFEMAKEPPPSNYSRDFTEAVKKGWIHEEGENSYITSTGLEAVQAGFPDEVKFANKPGPKARPRNARKHKNK